MKQRLMWLNSMMRYLSWDPSVYRKSIIWRIIIQIELYKLFIIPPETISHTHSITHHTGYCFKLATVITSMSYVERWNPFYPNYMLRMPYTGCISCMLCWSSSGFDLNWTCAVRILARLSHIRNVVLSVPVHLNDLPELRLDIKTSRLSRWNPIQSNYNHWGRQQQTNTNPINL